MSRTSKLLKLNDFIRKKGLEKYVKIYTYPKLEIEIPKDDPNQQLAQSIHGIKLKFQEEMKIGPPDSLSEFEYRLDKFLDREYKAYFGLALLPDLDERQTLNKKPSYSDLIDLAIKLSKKFANISFPRQEPYKFLKMALERGYPFSNMGQYYLGLYIDVSKFTVPKMNQIAVQAAAQVLWYLEKEKIETIEMMQKRLLDQESKIFHLLQLDRFNITTTANGSDSATIRRWICKVFPKPKQSRKGRPSKRGAAAEDYSNLVTIANVFIQKNGVNFINYQRLHFVITCITKVLQLCGWSVEQILESEIVQHYREPLVFYPKQYVNDWVNEAFKKNGSIFD